MTVPMSDQHSIVVAETLTEFLGLGYHVGWFSLEQLAYDVTWTLAILVKPIRTRGPSRRKRYVS